MLYPIEAGWTPTPAGFDLRFFDTPAALQEALASGAIDAAFAPPTTYAALRDDLVILSRPALTYDMAGNSPFLVSARRIDSTDTPSVALSQTAPFGNVLFKLLASPYFGLRPTFSDVPDDLAAVVAQTDGRVIGTDEGLRQRARAEQLYAEARAREEAEDEADAENDDGETQPHPRRRRAPGESLYVEDLSKAWWILTNYPLPLGLTLARRDWALINTAQGLAITPEAVALANALTEALRQSSQQTDSVIAAGVKQIGTDDEALRALLAGQRYSLTDAARRGLTEFYSKAAAAHLLPPVGLSIAELG